MNSESPKLAVPFEKSLGARMESSAGARDDARACTFLLVRHGITEHTVAGVISGGDAPGPHLNEEGRAQAAAAAKLVARAGKQLWPNLAVPSRIYSSPMVRTQDTAQIIAAETGLEVVVEDDLHELLFGDWNGARAQDVMAQYGAQLGDWLQGKANPAPGAETVLELKDRIEAVLTKLALAHPHQTLVLTVHNGVVRAALAATLGLLPEQVGKITALPASLTVLRWWPDYREIIAVGLPYQAAL